MVSSRRARGRSGERGAVVVEFALVMPILFLLLLGIIQYGVYFWSMNTGSNAVGDAVRRLSVGDCQSTTELKKVLSTRLSSATTTSESSLGVTVSYQNSTGTTMAAPGEVGGNVRLTLVYNAPDFNFPLIPVPDGAEVTRVFDARVEDISPIAGGCV